MIDCMTDYEAIPDQKDYEMQDMLDAMEIMVFLNAMPEWVSITKSPNGHFVVRSTKMPYDCAGETLLEAVRWWRKANAKAQPRLRVEVHVERLRRRRGW